MKYVPSIVHKTKYRDEPYVIVLEPLSRQAMLRVNPVLLAAKDLEIGAKSSAVLDAAYDVLGDHLVSVEATDEDGGAITKEVVLSKAFFVPLVRELFSVLVGASSLGEARSSSSEEKSSELTTELPLTTSESAG